MKLEDFISETLQQIINGVEKSQAATYKSLAIINPVGRASQLSVQTVEFDVALSEMKSKKAKGVIGVFFPPVGVGSQGQSDTSNISTNRIRFSVPLILPRKQEKPNTS